MVKTVQVLGRLLTINFWLLIALGIIVIILIFAGINIADSIIFACLVIAMTGIVMSVLRNLLIKLLKLNMT